jgi:hypothetical protein
VARAFDRELTPLDSPERGQWTPAALFEKFLVDAPRREAWLHALATAGAELGARRIALFERLAERRSELGLRAVAPSSEALASTAEFLRVTRDATRELGLRSFAELVQLALGTDVPGAWPAAPSARKLGDWFREGRLLDGLSPQLGHLPKGLGASSSLRALGSFGRALHDAGANARHPFVVSRDPGAFRARTFGALFMLLPLHASFAERRLEVGRGRFEPYRRALGRVVLLGALLQGLRARLARAALSGASAYRRCFREELPELLGFELPEQLAGVLLADEHGESDAVALFCAASADESFTQRYDEDWFRNPRCVDELRGQLEGTPELTPDPDVAAAGATLLGRRLVALL